MLALLLATLLLGDQDMEKAQVVQGTSGARSAQLELHAGGVVARQDEIGTAFGTVRIGTGKPQLSYVVLFKHRLSNELPLECSDETFAEGDTASSKQVLAIDGKSLVLDYQLKLDRTKPPRKTLSLNRKPVELSKGRVFLVDLTVQPPRWEQRKVELTVEVGETMSKKGSEELARKLLSSLPNQDAKIKEFIDAISR